MNKFFHFILFISISFISISQNLVPNPSFEEFTNCPYQPDQMDFLNYWEALSTPDFFSSCGVNGYCGSLGYRTPRNCLGFEVPRNGKSYIGLYSYETRISNKRELIYVKLKETLIGGFYYKISYFSSLADTSMYALNSFGIVLTKFDPETLSINDVFNINPILNSKLNTKVSGWEENTFNFQALGGEDYLIIGNMLNDNLLNILTINNNAQKLSGAYYYIDDVSLTQVYNKDMGVSLDQLNVLCPLEEEYINLRFRNEGVDTLSFTKDPLSYTAEVSANSTVVQSVSGNVSDNSLNPGGVPLAPDSSFVLRIGPIDFTQINQDYRLQVTVNLPGDEQLSNNSIDTLFSSQITLGNLSVSDSLLCYGETLRLTAADFKGSAEWQLSYDGSNWQRLSNEASHLFEPRASAFYRFSVCNLLFSDTFEVEVQNPSLVNSSLEICVAGDYLIAPAFSSDVQQVSWYASETDTLAFHNGFQYNTAINADTVFYLEMSSSFCTSERQTYAINFGKCELEIPNIFSPNGDGINDVFLYGNAEGKSIETKIFNRWGEKIAEWKGNAGWDGHAVNDGVYYYLIKADGAVFKGTVTLVR